MAQAFPNAVRFLVTNPGTSTFTVGSTPAGAFALSDVTDGDTVDYTASDKSGGIEHGTGAVGSSGTTLTRTVFRSSNANAAVNFTGVTEVAIVVSGRRITFPSVSTSALSSDLSLTTTSYFDVVSLSLAAGTYMISAQAACANASYAESNFTAKIHDGTTVIASGKVLSYQNDAGTADMLCLSGSITLASPGTVYLSVKSDNGGFGSFIDANVGDGNNASIITAVKLNVA